MDTLPTFQSLSKTDKIDNILKAVIERGNILVFRNTMNGVVKLVNEWKPDSQYGDLEGFESTGLTKFVCPYAVQYDVFERTPDGNEIKVDRNPDLDATIDETNIDFENAILQ